MHMNQNVQIIGIQVHNKHEEIITSHQSCLLFLWCVLEFHNIKDEISKPHLEKKKPQNTQNM